MSFSCPTSWRNFLPLLCSSKVEGNLYFCEIILLLQDNGMASKRAKVMSMDREVWSLIILLNRRPYLFPLESTKPQIYIHTSRIVSSSQSMPETLYLRHYDGNSQQNLTELPFKRRTYPITETILYHVPSGDLS